MCDTVDFPPRGRAYIQRRPTGACLSGPSMLICGWCKQPVTILAETLEELQQKSLAHLEECERASCPPAGRAR